MSPELIAAILGGLILVLIIVVVIRRKTPRKLKADVFVVKWKELQGYCKDKATWPLAITEADRLLDLALKKRKFSGKSMGERMVSAQRLFSNNDSVWFAHNLYKKILSEPKTRMKEADVKTALVGFRQALKDIGALPNGESKDA